VTKIAGKFITRLPVANGIGAVRVRESDHSHARAWDARIQVPHIRSTKRIDAGWSWSTLYLRSTMLEIAARRRLAYLQLVAPTATGDEFPLGQVLISDGFPYPPNEALPCAFLWYLAGTPAAALQAAEVVPRKALFPALVDIAIQFSLLSGYDGRICLHASPSGSTQQRAELMERYRGLGLKRWTGGWLGWFRRNDGRYFYADTPTARLLSSNLDAYR
jgi:hypothetical protein